MDFSRFDKYYRYLILIPLLIALLTYWKFREINLSEAYSYVAQQNVIRPMFLQAFSESRSIVWNFFGLWNKILIPDSIILLRLIGLCLTVLNYFLFSKLVNAVLGQRFWGFISAFLVALSPLMVVAAVSGISAAGSLTISILFLTALYRNEYVFGGILSGVAVAANLPGFIMLLITILDLLQNSADKKIIVRKMFSSAAGFFGMVLVILVYSKFQGAVRLSSFPLPERDMPWSLAGVAPLFVVNIVNVAGAIYLIVAKRYEIYRIHFHSFMLWIAFAAFSFAQPTTTNLISLLLISTFLATLFVQSFASIWELKFLSAETFVFIFVVIFLFADVFANGKYLQDNILLDCREKARAVDEVVDSIKPNDDDTRIISNFAPSELAVKLMRPVVAIQGEPFPSENINFSGKKTIYVVDKTSKINVLTEGCKALMKTSYGIGRQYHYVEVIQTEGK